MGVAVNGAGIARGAAARGEAGQDGVEGLAVHGAGDLGGVGQIGRQVCRLVGRQGGRICAGGVRFGACQACDIVPGLPQGGQGGATDGSG